MAQADLSTLLQELNPKNSIQNRVHSLGQIMDWIRLPAKLTEESHVPDFIRSRDIRFKFLFQYLDRNEAEAKNLAATLKEIVIPGGAVGLYCLTGISENHGFFNELSNRVVQKFIPDIYAEKDLSTIFQTLFTEEEDAIWLEHSCKTIVPTFIEFLKKHTISFDPLRTDRVEAMIILGAQVATFGTAQDIRRRLEKQRLIDSSFLRLNATINRESSETQENILKEIQQSRLDLENVRKNIEASGVSVDLIFRLEKINFILDRLEMLIYLGREHMEETRPIMIGQFMGRLVRDEIKTLGVKVYIRENLHLLTRKIVERAGDRGQNYIATTYQEKLDLFVSSSWAGVLTAFTALLKFLIGISFFPLFFEGFFFFLNYAVSFLMMQRFHLALSSKQPAYTASSLAEKLETFKQTKKMEVVSVEIKKIMFSQMLTTLGNLLWVGPVVVLLDWAWFFATDAHFMSHVDALTTINKHNLITSLTIPYAILTGILLWFSSVIAGWVENWIVFRDIPEAIRSSSLLNRLFGPQTESMAKNFAATMGGISGNISIALFMGFPVIIGKFMAIPLDIRHVTLAAGTITFALNSLEWNLYQYWPQIIHMFFSVLIIGIMNFSVSFYFALRMAALGRNVESKYVNVILRHAFKRNPPEKS